MNSSTNTSSRPEPSRSLPHRLRLLFVGPGEPPWALLALRLESAGCSQAEFDWEAEVSAALARLRKVHFDCIVVRDTSDEPEKPSSALQFAGGLRVSGCEDPIAVVADRAIDDHAVQLCELDCQLLVTGTGWHSRALVALIGRALALGDLRRENAGLELSSRRNRQRERESAERELQQLREIVERVCPPEGRISEQRRASKRPDVLLRIEEFYGELLRAYIMMGSGNLSKQLQQLTELILLAGLSPAQAMSIHVEQLTRLLQGLGSRSSRHVMFRAELLAMELMMLLGERYRRKSSSTGLGDAGVDLLHAESLLQRPQETDF